MTSIAINRIIVSTLEQQPGSISPDFDAKNKELSLRIWHTYPYARKLKQLGCIFLLTALVISFESANPLDRAWVINTLYDLEEYRRLEPDRWTEHGLIYACGALTGRGESVCRPNVRSE